MVRVAGRMRRMAAGLPVERASGRSPAQILENTLDTAGELTRRHAECFSDSVLPALVREGIEILRWKELEQAEQEALQRLFRERIYPVLTPLVVDPAHPFPYISGLSLSLAVMIADPATGDHDVRPGEGAPAAAQVPDRGAVPVRAARGRDRRPPARAVRGPRRARAPRVPGDPDPRPRDRRGRDRGPAEVDGARADSGAASSRRSGSRSRSRCPATCWTSWSPSSASTPARCTGCPGRSTCPA